MRRPPNKAAVVFIRRTKIDMTGIVLLWILPGLFVAAAITDLTSFTIPNVLPAAMLVLFAILRLAMALSGHALGWSEISPHLLAGTIGLVVGLGMFATGWVGGGDAKLLAAACLWVGWDALIQYAILATLFGGLLTIWLLMLRRMPMPPFLATKTWFVRLADSKSGVPYGIALAIAAIDLLPDTDLFRLVATN
jgi:prepilin peptidase CpaA